MNWYEDQQDRELHRSALLLERLAYEEDVRKIIKRIITSSNEIDPKEEEIYLHQ